MSFPVRLLPKVDGYVARSMLLLFLLSAAAVCFLVAVVDAFQQMEDFIEFGKREGYEPLATAFLVVEYYVCLTPRYFVRYMAPFIMLLAGALTASHMSSHREFTALRAGGVPLQRVLAPILVCALCIGGAVFLGRDAVIPGMSRLAHKIDRTVHPRSGQYVTRVMRDDETVTIYAVGHFDVETQTAYNFLADSRDTADLRAGRIHELRRVTASEARLGDGVWTLGHDRRLLEQGRYRRVTTTPDETLPTDVTPAMIEQQLLGTAVMTSADLAALADEPDKQVELARRRAAPFAGFLILLVGLPLVVRREITATGTAGRVLSIILAVLVCGLHYLLQAAFLGLAEADRIPVTLGAWAPNILFAAWGFAAFRRSNV